MAAVPDDDIRLTEILTTASAVANYLGEVDVSASHLAHAIAILLGETTLEDLGRPLSPLIRRVPPGQAGGADPEVRALAQRWFAELGGDVTAVLTPQQLIQLREEIARLRA